MAELLERKVGIVSCSGEELPEGTVARLAALKVLNELRLRETVTICLPLFLAGGAGDRAFARLHPTITVDGCELRCAARATEKYSNKPAASLVVNEIVSQTGLAKPEGRRRLNAAGQEAVSITAERMASLVDQVLGKEAARSPQDQPEARAGGEAREATCSCGSGVPVTKLVINGRVVEVVALPLIFRQFQQSGRGQDEESKRDLFETVKIYNPVPLEVEEAYRDAVLREYAVFRQKERP
ncbi:MAG TPA: putative zinc-binding protein [Verrucomicrobiae bacterium]